MARKQETKVKEKVLKYLSTSLPGYWMKNHGNMYQKGGRPDIEGCYCGKFIAIELKKDKYEDEDPRQHYWLKKIAEAGGIGIGQVSSVEMLEELMIGSMVGLKEGIFINADTGEKKIFLKNSGVFIDK